MGQLLYFLATALLICNPLSTLATGLPPCNYFTYGGKSNPLRWLF